MEDVIFGGTSQRKALGYAEVTLRLDNSDRGLNNCDKDDVAVTRRYYRSGESEYKINGEECRLRDIHELFMDTGLGRDGYSMVGQGRIADLVSARSTQRRDMLEEAAGISHFRYRRADANRRLEQAEENLVRLRDILAELESRIGPLKTQSEKALKFLALADEKKTLEIGLWLHTIEKSKNGLKEQEHKLSLASAQYEQTESELAELIAQIEQAIKEGQEMTLEIERLRQSISESEEEAAVIGGQIAVERNTIEHNNQTIERITGDMGDSDRSAAEIDAQIEKAEAIERVEREQLRRLARVRTEQIHYAYAKKVQRDAIGPVDNQNWQHNEEHAERRARITRLVERADPDGGAEENAQEQVGHGQDEPAMARQKQTRRENHQHAERSNQKIHQPAAHAQRVERGGGGIEKCAQKHAEKQQNAGRSGIEERAAVLLGQLVARVLIGGRLDTAAEYELFDVSQQSLQRSFSLMES